jgi:hypothetical protein
MKKMKLTMLLVVFVFAALNMVKAQEKMEEIMRETTPEQRAALQTSYMKENLALAEDQTPKVQEINLKYARKMQDAYNSTERKFQKLKQMKSINQQKDGEMKNVLSAEQYETYEKNKEAMRESVKEKRKEN